MKKLKNFSLVLIAALCLVGCGEKFEPTESTIYIDSKGTVKSAIMESFDKNYYDFNELSEQVKKEVKSYNLDVNEEAIIVDSLNEANKEVTLMMTYQSAEVYEKFNEVLLFHGTYAEAVAAGYVPDELYDAEGQLIDTKDEKLAELKVVVTEESVNIQTAGKIRYVSSNVTLVDKKLARAMEAGANYPAFVLYK